MMYATKLSQACGVFLSLYVMIVYAMIILLLCRIHMYLPHHFSPHSSLKEIDIVAIGTPIIATSINAFNN
jgi:hypothetical protein